jgi:nucleoside-diphosphate-sugar epimerase
MKVLVLGSKGRLGGALARMWAPDYEVRALARPELDVADLPALGKLLESESYDVPELHGADECGSLRERPQRSRDRQRRAPGVMAKDARKRAVHSFQH